MVWSIAASCSSRSESNYSKNPYFYPDSIELERKEKDVYLREGEMSPLKVEDKTLFQGLSYFPPDERFVVKARFEALPETDTLILQTSDRDQRPMLRAGYLYFALGKDTCRLTALRAIGVEGRMQRELFVPFKDATNGTDTYRAGRYVNVRIPASGQPYIVDFNRAFNPYCAYNEEYSCPLVPLENVLPVRIEAGEKIFFRPRP
ncbi:MAG: DUF1684 domain-containing protein [Bacteroidota bacterium]|nr:DUF1684 domain-containing protein [Candidatus Kapabacteria bacterium]MDW8220090.1 DUF1684 domain-containing protein [Bacteroidota bacterium]